MSLAKEEIEAVVAYRKEKAYNTLKEAEDMIDTKQEKMSHRCWNQLVIY